MAGLVDRMIRAAKLQPALYEEVESDAGATGQAMTVVVLSALAAGVGTFSEHGVGGALGNVILALIGWFLWAFLTWILGTKLLAEPETNANLGEMLRTIGFSSAPGVIRVLGIVPGLSHIVGLAASVWMLAAMIIAVRQALDFSSTWRAILVCVIGWLVYAGITVGVLAGLLAGTGVLPK